MPTLINQDINLVYLHFKKTGGWLVHDILKSYNFKVIDINKYGGHLGQEFFDKEKYFTFGFVRHPVDWYISMFNFLNQNGFIFRGAISNEIIDLRWAKTNTLDEFITEVRTGKNIAFNLISEYVNFFCLNSPNYCEHIYRYENMFLHLKEVLSKFNIDISQEINRLSKTRINKSDHKDTIISGYNLEYIYYSCDPIFNKFSYEKYHKI